VPQVGLGQTGALGDALGQWLKLYQSQIEQSPIGLGVKSLKNRARPLAATVSLVMRFGNTSCNNTRGGQRNTTLPKSNTTS
jgi:hypothetical protein